MDALEAAAYRLIGIATCQIEQVQNRLVCHLQAQNNSPRWNANPIDGELLKTRFLELVTDENIRSRIAKKTEGVRNVILALAFGSLAASQDNSEH